jgi:release factor glutamine methyltransferase
MGLILRMDLQQAQQEMLSRLRPLYEDREAVTITDWVMEKITGWKKIDRIIHKNMSLSQEGLELFRLYAMELENHRPVQYVLQEAWFSGFKFYVDEQVLIPRPETEELVEWVVAELNSLSGENAILDVGTGSGCIAVALKRQLPEAHVYACDLSPGALAIAERNAVSNRAPIHFHQLDFLDSSQWNELPPVQTLISNPPYIPLGEKETMAPHVIGFEPHLALFVEDGDPLIFYRALARFALIKLPPGGQVFAEIHEGLGEEVKQHFQQNGFQSVILRKDMQGKNRMVKATR